MANFNTPVTFNEAVVLNGAVTFAETPAEIVLTNLTALAIGADGLGTAAPALSLKKTAAGTGDVNFLAADDLRGRVRLNASEAIVIETFDASEVSTGTITMANADGAITISSTLTVTGNITGSATVTGADLVATDDLTVGDDAAITGALTVGETLGVTGTATMAAVNSTALAATTSLTVTGATIVGMKAYVAITAASLVGTTVYSVICPYAGTVNAIKSVLQGALTTGDATLTAKINSTAITTGVLTLTQSGSAAGDIDSCSPSAAKTVVAGDLLSWTVGGTNDAEVGATGYFEIIRSA